MIDDLEPLIPEEPIDDDLDLDDEGHPKKKAKDLIDDDTVSLEDEADEELEDEDEPFDDVDEQ